jgi:hypothetical protein
MGLSFKELEKWVGTVGWVHPTTRAADKGATIAVKVIGVNYGYGRWLFKVEPLAGTGSWQVEYNRVMFDRGDEL